MPARFKFTEDALAALPPAPPGKRATYHDAEAPALKLRVTATGAKSYYFVHRVRNGPMEWIHIGPFGDTKLRDARNKAREYSGDVAKHHNPNESRRAQKGEPTLGDFFEVFIDQRRNRRGKPLAEKTRLDYRNDFNRKLKPWKDKPLSAFTKDDAERLHRDYGREHPTAANRIAALISSLYGYASERKEYRGTNPAANIKKFGETSRDRVLEAGEVKRFWSALQAEENDVARDFFTVALLTGARRTNVLTMAWQDVDIATKEWRIPQTKAGGGLTVPLVVHLVSLLKKRKKTAVNGYVFPGEGRAGHFAEPRKAWERILARAGLADVHIHDLRRTLGTAMAATGANMATSMRMLGHRTTHAALIYQRLTVDPVRAAADRATDALLGAAGVKPRSKRKSPGPAKGVRP